MSYLGLFYVETIEGFVRRLFVVIQAILGRNSP